MNISRILTKLTYLFQAIFLKRDIYCPFCSGSDFEIVFKKKGLIDICRCRKCCLYWTNPIFKFWRFYDFLYKAEGLTTKLDKNNLNSLLSRCFGDSDKDYRKIIKWLKSISSGEKLLEFGSSWGYFLYQAQNLGFKSVGVEISKKRAEFGKTKLGVEIVADINILLQKKGKFDVIFSAHTLEHIGYGIKDIFKYFNALLAKNGIIVIEVPGLNFDKNRKTFQIMGAVHPLGFVKEFFIINLAQYGFEVKVYNGYENLVADYGIKKGDNNNLVIVCKKL